MALGPSDLVARPRPRLRLPPCIAAPRAAIGALAAVALGACSLLAPADRDLMGDPATDASVAPDPDPRADGGGAGGTDAAARPPGADGSVAADAATPTDPASCALCNLIPPSCYSASDCGCLAAALCGDGGTCLSAGDTVTERCGERSCSRSAGVVFCRVGAGYCACN